MKLKKKSFFLQSVGILLFFSMLTNFGWAANTKGMVIFDFTKMGENDSRTRSNVYTIFNKRIIKEIEKLKKASEISSYVNDPQKNGELICTRWFTVKHDLVKVYVLCKNEHADNVGIKITEKNRKSRLGEDISTLAGMVQKLFASKKDVPLIKVEKEYRLRKTRSTLIVQAGIKPENKNVKDFEEKVEILTGPREHLFLSADLPVEKISDFKYSEDPGSFEPKEKPTEFYLGLNWMFGDVLSEKQALWKLFFFKGMLRFSKSPLDSVGVALGFRFPEVRFLGFDLSSFSVFYGVIWTRQEDNDKREPKWSFGFSFNLDKALGWLKK